MGGLRDLLTLLIGWKSAAPGADSPWRTAAGRVWHTGAVAGQHDAPGQRAGQVSTNGPLAGQIHG